MPFYAPAGCCGGCGAGGGGGSQAGEGTTLRNDSQSPNYQEQAARALAPFMSKEWEKIADAAASIPKAADYKTAAEEYVKSDTIQEKLADGKPGIIYLYTAAKTKVGAKEMVPPETEAST
ncbi:MAG: hypothetical protein N3A66_11265, partial [Planctomycetota bacterium]|nr:hypothetical protein [Planctomycetota bacterium]